MSDRNARQLVLKPQEIYLPLALLSRSEAGTTYPGLSAFTGLAMSAVHAALKRAEAARLLLFEEKQPRVLRPALREFLLHGAKYAFPPVRGGMVLGIPTAHAAPPLVVEIASLSEPPPVWPSLEGTVRGIAFVPIYPSAPAAALRDAALYENLALFDALRAGSARERTLAARLFEKRL